MNPPPSGIEAAAWEIARNYHIESDISRHLEFYGKAIGKHCISKSDHSKVVQELAERLKELHEYVSRNSDGQADQDPEMQAARTAVALHQPSGPAQKP